MEKPKSQAEIRHDRFLENAQAAKALANTALNSVDSALADEDRLRVSFQCDLDFGTMSQEEVDGYLSAYHETRFMD